MSRVWRAVHVAVFVAMAIGIAVSGSPLFWGVPTDRIASPADVTRTEDSGGSASGQTADPGNLSGSTVEAIVFLTSPDGRLFPVQRTIPTPSDEIVRYCPDNAQPGECQDDPGDGLSPTRIPLSREAIASARARSVLNSLMGGPTAAEEGRGATTTVFADIVSDLFAVSNDETDDVRATAGGTIVLNIAPGSSYTRLEGDNQRLATAQIVWTLTDIVGVETVRIRVGGQDIGVPSDGGIAPASAPVDRSNYASFAPVEPLFPDGAGTGSGDPETGSVDADVDAEDVIIDEDDLDNSGDDDSDTQEPSGVGATSG